ncbi:hypothetical protein ACFZBU_47665 [Embleya sp. NPDC008237]|uniref:hypothetical protein n=1 Tax=Embleya sp. NPDC008237 TaxID=3363978 RepID=UPI0036E70255
MADTQLIGMAGSLAALVRGQEVIDDAQALRAVAAEQLDVNQFAFDAVVEALAEIGFVEGVRRTKGKIVGFTENVPYYGDLYAQLGAAWRARGPSEIEEQMVMLVDHLSEGPTAEEEVADEAGLDSSAMSQLLEVGERAELVKRIQLPDGDVLYSPFFGFENPQVISDLVRDHGAGELAAAFAAVSGEQGLPVGDTQPLLQDAIARGLLMAPSVKRPDGVMQPFASLPYTLDRELLRGRKPVLEKALAVLACLRCGQHFGGATGLSAGAMVNSIDKLLDPHQGFLRPHGSHARQYHLLLSNGLLAFDPDTRPDGKWVTPRFIDTPDNREAMQIARDLITFGEQLSGRVGDEQARQMLAAGQSFAAPMQTMHRTRAKAPVSVKQWQAVANAALGRGRAR